MRLVSRLALAGLALAMVPSMVSAEALVAAIELGRDPEPPFCAASPDGVVDIFWDVEHTTTPNFVRYLVQDPTRTIDYVDVTYTLSTGITIDTDWPVPAGAPAGKYSVPT